MTLEEAYEWYRNEPNALVRLLEMKCEYESMEECCDKYSKKNARLWKLARMFADYISYDRCEGCFRKYGCNNGAIDECPYRTQICDEARELGIEVGE